MALTGKIEDGTGIEGALVYSSVADAEALLAERGLTRFAALATEAEQEADLIAATASVDSSFRSTPDGVPLSERQGLYFPRDFPGFRRTAADGVSYEGGGPGCCSGPAFLVPPPAILAAALKAEYRVLERSADNSFSGLPEDMKSVTLAKGVRVELADGARLRTVEMRQLQAQIRASIQAAQPTNSWEWAA